MKEYVTYLLLTVAGGGLLAKLNLLLALLAANRPDVPQGPRLLSAVFAGQFLVGAITALYHPAGGWPFIVVGLGLGVAMAVAAAQDTIRWQVLPAEGMPRVAALATYALAFWFPLFPEIGWVRALWASPMGLLPHAVFVAMAVAVVSTWPRFPAGLAVGAGLAAAIVAVLDVVAFGAAPRQLVVLGAGVAMLASTMVGKAEDSGAPPPGEEGDAPPPATDKRPDGGSRRWDLR